MIALIGSTSDVVFQVLRQQVQHERLPHVCLEVSQIGSQIRFDRHGMNLYGERLPYAAISLVYNRILDFSQVSFDRSGSWGYLMWWLDCQALNVLNRPQRMSSNFFKPSQFSLMQLYFALPKTYVVQAGSVRWPGFVMKSISSVRTRVVEAPLHQSLQEPLLLQARIQGQPIRVHVIGTQVIAYAIESQVLDYRYDREVVMRRYHLPKAKENSAVALTQALGLVFSGVDLIHVAGEYYCLEVNTSPGWPYFDQMAQSNAVAEALINHMRQCCTC